MKIDKVSVVVVVFNEEQYMQRCVESILTQSYSSFELIIVDDCSTDCTAEIINEIKDSRICYTRNSERRGIAHSRNVGIQKSSTEHIFFMDADCVSTKYWLQEGVEAFEGGDCLGVEGKTCYETAWASIVDKIIENTKGGAYNTCNIGYCKQVLEDVGMFNEEYKFVSEDTDLARKVLKKGVIYFLPDMLVFHLRKKQAMAGFFQIAFRVFSKVKYIKNTGDHRACFWRIMYPAHLAFILFPPLLIFRYRIATFKEVLLLPIIYLSYVFERTLIWVAAVREGIFLL